MTLDDEGARHWRPLVALGAASGVAAAVAAYLVLAAVSAGSAPLATLMPGQRLAAAAGLLVWPALFILALTIAVGAMRFLTGAVVPDRPGEARFLRVSTRALTNTVEQTAVLALLTLAIAGAGRAGAVGELQAAVLVFVGARIAFLAGYLLHPLARAFGMGATFAVNLGLAAHAATDLFVR